MAAERVDHAAASSIQPSPGELTPRERAALTALASGLTVETAARQMGVSGRTLRRAQKDAADRLGVPTPIQAVVIAAAGGLIDMEQVRGVRAPRGWLEEECERTPAQRAASVDAGRALGEWQRARAARRRAAAWPLFEQGFTAGEVAARVGVTVESARSYRRELQERQAGSGGAA